MVLKRFLFCNRGGPSSSTVNYNVHKSWKKKNVLKLVEMARESKTVAFFFRRCRCTPDFFFFLLLLFFFSSILQYLVQFLLRCQLENDGMTPVPVRSKEE